MTDSPATHLPTGALHEGRRADDELDPELLELPDPPKRERTWTVALLLVTALASLAMVVTLRRDAAYAFAAPAPRDLGDLNTADARSFVENEHVRAAAMLGAAHAIRYERPLTPGSFRLMPVPRAAGGVSDVWVEVHVPSGAENVRWVPPSQISGRLVRFDAAGPRHRGLAGAVRDTTGQELPKDAWLLVDGAAPASARWAVLLVALFAGFAAWNAFATAKLLRKVKS